MYITITIILSRLFLSTDNQNGCHAFVMVGNDTADPYYHPPPYCIRRG